MNEKKMKMWKFTNVECLDGKCVSHYSRKLVTITKQMQKNLCDEWNEKKTCHFPRLFSLVQCWLVVVFVCRLRSKQRQGKLERRKCNIMKDEFLGGEKKNKSWSWRLEWVNLFHRTAATHNFPFNVYLKILYYRNKTFPYSFTLLLT